MSIAGLNLSGVMLRSLGLPICRMTRGRLSSLLVLFSDTRVVLSKEYTILIPLNKTFLLVIEVMWLFIVDRRIFKELSEAEACVPFSVASMSDLTWSLFQNNSVDIVLVSPGVISGEMPRSACFSSSEICVLDKRFVVSIDSCLRNWLDRWNGCPSQE